MNQDSVTAGRRVLVPGTAGSSVHAVDALVAAGAVPLVVPFVSVVPPEQLGPLDAALAALEAGRFGWLAVTSAAGVRALDERARALGRTGLAAVLGGSRVAAVGSATAAALEALGVPALVPDSVPALVPGPAPSPGSGAAGLVGPLARAARGSRVLFARGDLAAPVLTDGLHAAGVEVEDVIVYRTVPAAPPPADLVRDWSAGRIDAVLLTSPSTARAVLDALGPPPAATLVACLGPTTAAAVRALGLRVDVLSPTPTLPALVRALVDHWKDPT
ncbi:MAG: uroporphyrinogen-III synthase [Actinobacteria bacterium]|nr:uroporphyrinogen-III synthase [Actinomycetota bacterium]MCG2800532.1 uroporphyrinogen-III synthase [Cellulomonas sp.]